MMMSVFTQEQATNMILKERYNEGKLEGIQENTVSIARAMKEQGLSMDMIVSITGLTEEEIINL